jgi:hypothetical protein
MLFTVEVWILPSHLQFGGTFVEIVAAGCEIYAGVVVRTTVGV